MLVCERFITFGAIETLKSYDRRPEPAETTEGALVTLELESKNVIVESKAM